MEVSHEVSSLRPLERLLPLIVDRAIHLLGAERGFLMLRGDDGSLDFQVALDAHGNQVGQAAFQVSRSVIREVARTGRAVLTSDAREDERFREERSVVSLDLRSVLVVPLLVGDRTLGVVYLDNRFDAGVFDDADRDLLEAFATQAAVGIENARLYDSVAERERMAQELRIAGRIQGALLPQRFPEVPPFSFAARTTPAREVGGDFYDRIEGEDGIIRLAMGDVSGKGVPAGLLMVMARTVLRSLARDDRSPRRILTLANEVIGGSIEADSFITMLLMALDPERGEVLCSSAGQEPLIHFEAATGATRFLPIEGIALGVLPDASGALRDERIPLAPGDLLLAYTDGVPECRAPDGSFYGRGRLCAVVGQRGAGRPPEELIAAVLEDLERFRAGEEPSDDVTLVAVKRAEGVAGDSAGSGER
jgi:serine phosphatase RsbU (regulator of sigma subunit)